MSKFITGKELEKAVYDIIWYAEETLLIVSPYIKLSDYFKSLFDNLMNNQKVQIILVFGKNEKDVCKSMSVDDFDYFKKFINISVIYVPNLHAKYYGNESKGVITSINLHDFSFQNNIEYGVFTEKKLINIGSIADNQAWETSWNIAIESEAVFIKRPVFEKRIIGKRYIKSDVLYDVTDKFYSHSGFAKKQSSIKRLTDFPEELMMGSGSNVRPEREEVENKNIGYCIRTGVEIPFDPEKPLCEQAYASWARYKNPDFKEKFCHKTGKPSFGKTSMRNPILKG
jgi:hypothetical protein